MILKAAWVLPISGPPIRNGAVWVRGERIAAVGRIDGAQTAHESITDLGSVILTPGLVNAHTHLELTGYAGRLRPGPFWSWLLQLVELRRSEGKIEHEQQGVYEGAWQSLRAGVTCVGDISRRNLHWSVLKTVPIRKVCFVELLSVADEPPRDPDELRQAVQAVQEDALLTVGISPHAPYTVPVEHIRAAIRLAAQLGRPWCSHWAETQEECAFLSGRAGIFHRVLVALLSRRGVRCPGGAPIEVLEQCCEGGPPGLLAHFNYARAGDAQRLAAAGHAVAYCPRAHRFFGHPPHPYREFLMAGVTVAIASDSPACNQNLALLEELRFLREETSDTPPPQTLLRMVTLDAARALGLNAHIGSLEPGKQADLAAFPCDPQTSDPAAVLVDQAPRPIGVWVAGQRVV